MKSIIVILGVVFFVSFCFSPASAELLKKHTAEVGVEVSHITYEEPGVMEDKGMMYGVSGSYTYHHPEPTFMLKGEGKFSCGQVDYSSSNTGDMDNVDDFMLEYRGLGGYDFFISQTFVITPYTGIGYRYLNDDSGGMTTTTGAWGYERESNYFYSPIGIEVITDLENGWSLGGMIEYDLFWAGKQKSHLSDVVSYSDLENDQDSGYGIKGSVRIQKKNADIDIVIEPFIRYWAIEKSNESDLIYEDVIIGYGYEPENDSVEIGFKLAINF